MGDRKAKPADTLTAQASRYLELLEACARASGYPDAPVEAIPDRVRVVVEDYRERTRNQYRTLLAIRELADQVTGVNRQEGDERDPGALGAVKLLVEKYRALQARIEKLDLNLAVFTEPYEVDD